MRKAWWGFAPLPDEVVVRMILSVSSFFRVSGFERGLSGLMLGSVLVW